MALRPYDPITLRPYDTTIRRTYDPTTLRLYGPTTRQPYVPMILTPVVYDPTNFTPRRGVMTRYAKKMVRPEFYGKVYIKDIQNV